ncbi:Hypothetical protein NTJ_07080 [Nesidiocoris tenuis]|uniref:Uncharacterized protein n=1 Tax=Nesidiocoris tenuis TaxID=355587 RepID=A0ABN7APX7_9HEMI|nr:Hypothetical protein NTJ_07080 [Nesidiocoris tenuis]
MGKIACIAEEKHGLQNRRAFFNRIYIVGYIGGCVDFLPLFGETAGAPVKYSPIRAREFSKATPALLIPPWGLLVVFVLQVGKNNISKSGRDNSGRQGYAATQESDAFEMRRNGADAAAAVFTPSFSVFDCIMEIIAFCPGRLVSVGSFGGKQSSP